MPNHPSALAMKNRVDLYRFAASYDADGTVNAALSYPSLPDVSSIPCSVQNTATTREENNGRETTSNTFLVIFGADHAPKLNDKFVWTDSANEVLYVDGDTDGAGRHAVYEVSCIQRV